MTQRSWSDSSAGACRTPFGSKGLLKQFLLHAYSETNLFERPTIIFKYLYLSDDLCVHTTIF